MRNLGSVFVALGDITAEGDSVDLNLEELVAVPPTSEIVEHLTRRQTEIEALRPKDGSPMTVRGIKRFLSTRIGVLLRDLARARLRDDMCAARSEGCWCLGLGGIDRRYLGPTTNDPEGERWVWARYCVCLDSVEVRMRHDSYRAERDNDRRARRLKRIWGSAGVPALFRDLTLDTYPSTAATFGLVASLRDWLDGSSWLMLYGSFGTGKTGLAIGLLRELAMLGQSVLFTTTADLLNRLRQTYSDDGGASESDVMSTLRDVDVLCLDDIGAERFTGWVAEKLFVLINHRHSASKRTLVTSNLSPEQLMGHLGERTMWRILELSTVVHVDGPNLRARP